MQPTRARMNRLNVTSTLLLPDEPKLMDSYKVKNANCTVLKNNEL